MHVVEFKKLVRTTMGTFQKLIDIEMLLIFSFVSCIELDAKENRTVLSASPLLDGPRGARRPRLPAQTCAQAQVQAAAVPDQHGEAVPVQEKVG